MPDTPDTINYMILGMAVALGTLSLYTISLWARFRGVARDNQTLDQLGED